MYRTWQEFDSPTRPNERTFFKIRIYAKYVASFDVACNNQHAPCVPSDVGNGQVKFSADLIRRCGDIRARQEIASSCEK